MGQTGTALPSEDPFAFIWNPAQLGYTSRNNNLSFNFYPSNGEWIPSFFNYELNSLAFNLGYNLKDIVDFPLSVGIGYSNVKYNYGLAGGRDDCDAYSLGFGIDYYCQFNAGFTYKSITSILSDRPVGGEIGVGKAEPNVFDFGFLFNIPISTLIDNDMQFALDDKSKLNLILISH